MSATEKPRKNPRWRKKTMRRRRSLIRVFTLISRRFIYKARTIGSLGYSKAHEHTLQTGVKICAQQTINIKEEKRKGDYAT
jgi:hypothetical protein